METFDDERGVFSVVIQVWEFEEDVVEEWECWYG